MGNPILSFEALAIGACLAVWVVAANRWRRGQTVIAYQPRRPVPWQAIDLAVVLLFYFALSAGLKVSADAIWGLEAAGETQKFTTEHVIGQLIAQGSVWELLLCGISAAVVAPVAEEFFFRVLLQGWLEAVARRWRRKMPIRLRRIPAGTGPVLLTALLFASMHFRFGGPRLDVQRLVILLAGDGIARSATIAFAVGLIWWRVRATAIDFGWVREKAWADVRLGLVTFMAVAVPVYTMHFGLRLLLPDYLAPDPIPLFFFALALGIVYYRTHRLVPIIVLHAALNGTSLTVALMAWLVS